MTPFEKFMYDFCVRFDPEVDIDAMRKYGDSDYSFEDMEKAFNAGIESNKKSKEQLSDL